MYQTFNILEFLNYLRQRWRVTVSACGIAMAFALAGSLLMAKRYTATASIVIEPPGGNDVRVATAVSPIYLESLRTYERFAGGDTLFARAAERFGLQHGARPNIEGLKQQVLRVSKLRDTKILEISITLPDPKLAQSVVQYLADETVALSESESRAADQEMIDEARKENDDARKRLTQAQTEWARAASQDPIDLLQTEIEENSDLAVEVRKQLMDAQAAVAEYQTRSEPAAREEVSAAQARADLLERKSEELGKTISDLSKTVSARMVERDRAQTEMKAAQSERERAGARLGELRASAGMRGERLRVIDPGIVPQRPSSPNPPLNVMIGGFLALVISLAYLTVAFVYQKSTVSFETAVSRGRRTA